jgi:hypothetical protein
MFKTDSCGKASSLAVFVNYTSNFIVTVSFPFIQDVLGSYSFIIFAILLMIFATFILFFVQETKGKSIDEIVTKYKHQYKFFGLS